MDPALVRRWNAVHPAHVPSSIHVRVVQLLRDLNEEMRAQLRVTRPALRDPVQDTVHLARLKANHSIVRTANRMLSRVVDIIEVFVRV